MKKQLGMAVGIVAAVTGAFVLGPGEEAQAKGGCSEAMQSITPNHSIYEPGREFGQDVAFTARGGYAEYGIDGVNDYVAMTKAEAGCK
jgi:hypothetical protein